MTDLNEDKILAMEVSASNPANTMLEPTEILMNDKGSTSWAGVVKLGKVKKENIQKDKAQYIKSGEIGSKSDEFPVMHDNIETFMNDASLEVYNESEKNIKNYPRLLAIWDCNVNSLINCLTRKQKYFYNQVGLVNRGNSCFMNAVLQVFLNNEWVSELLNILSENYTFSDFSASPLTESLVSLHKCFMSRTSKNSSHHHKAVITPDHFYESLKVSKDFLSSPGNQEDAQEFLGFLIEGFHEEMISSNSDLNWSHVIDFSGRPKELYKDESMGSASTEEWLQMSNIPSPLSTLFSGCFMSIVKRYGSKDSITFEPFNCIQLNIESRDISSLTDALKHLCSVERISFSNQDKSTKQILIHSSPPILIFHLKRFIFVKATQVITKLEKYLEFPFFFKFPPDCLSSEKSISGEYELFGLIEHHGRTVEGGHYTCYVQDSASQWFFMDDEKVKRLQSKEEVLKHRKKQSAYLLFYKLKTSQVVIGYDE